MAEKSLLKELVQREKELCFLKRGESGDTFLLDSK